MKKPVIITIDGPAGAGKSTIARMLARQLAFHYLDTGALYRAVTLKALQNKILPAGNESSIAGLVLKSDIKLRHTSNGKVIKVLLDGRDISREIRTPVITSHIYKVSALPPVRGVLRVPVRAAVTAATRAIIINPCFGRQKRSRLLMRRPQPTSVSTTGIPDHTL